MDKRERNLRRDNRISIAFIVLIFIGVPAAFWNYIATWNYNQMDNLFQEHAELWMTKKNTAHLLEIAGADEDGGERAAWIGTALDDNNKPLITITVKRTISQDEATPLPTICSVYYSISEDELEDLITNHRKSKTFKEAVNNQNCKLSGYVLDDQTIINFIRIGAKRTYAQL